MKPPSTAGEPQVDLDPGAAEGWSVGGADLAADRMGDRGDDGEAESGSAAGAAFAVRSGEPVEHPRQQLRAEAGAVVGDLQPAMVVHRADRDDDPAARMAAGVGDQIADDVLEPLLVAADVGRLSADLDVDAVQLGEPLDTGSDRGEQLRPGVTRRELSGVGSCQ